jgi:phytoene synthase
VPPGTARYWSWLFAAPQLRAPLLGIYALGAEWQALMDPALDAGVAHLKLAWWREEVVRLKDGSAIHPISGYLADLPRAASVDFTPLLAAVGAASAQVGGVPLERGADLEPQSQALWGDPLALASQLAAVVADEAALRRCTGALAAGNYLSKAIRTYRRDARVGRVPFAIDELLAARIDNGDLALPVSPPHLALYLDGARERSLRYFECAERALPGAERGRQRHLLVLAALGQSRLTGRAAPLERHRFKDMLRAWSAARGAHRENRSNP